MGDDVTTAVIGQLIDGVGPRLRALRRRRDTTLKDLSDTTGISASTLSRLEGGKRRPTLELLMHLALAHRVSLDDLVGAPPIGDPRVHIRAVHRNGQIVMSLTRRPGGIQAQKIVISAGETPTPARTLLLASKRGPTTSADTSTWRPSPSPPPCASSTIRTRSRWPSTTATSIATSCSHCSSEGSGPSWSNSVTCRVHCRNINAWCTDPPPEPSTPIGWSRISQPWQ